jgi:hypothetical protein
MARDGCAGAALSSSGGFSALLHGVSGHAVTSLAFDLLSLDKVLRGVGVHPSGGSYPRDIITALMERQRQGPILSPGSRHYSSSEAFTDEINRATNQQDVTKPLDPLLFAPGL